jgi:hypothetical protein
LLYVSQLFLQSATHGRTGLHAASSQTQEASDFVEFESQALNTAYEGKRIKVVFTILAEAALAPRGPPQ